MNIYEGTENYIFVSYAHKDQDRVLPVISELDKAGFRVWYDRGIEAGTEWPAYIQDHIAACARVLVFISQYSVDSVNCRNEINFAANKNKEMLVAYLEDTELKHGLGLQLGARQSIFRSRHVDDMSFVSELIKAKILQCCKEGADAEECASEPTGYTEYTSSQATGHTVDDRNDFNFTVQSRLSGPSLISRVGTMGSNDLSNLWPQGRYSQNIDVSTYMTVLFHCNLLRPHTTATVRKVGIRIFDEKDALVFENITSLSFKAGEDRFSLGWIIRESNGLSQTTGTYTALIWIDNSRAMEYPFRIVSSENYADARSTGHVDPKVQKEIDTLEKNLKYPKIALFQLLSWLTTIIGFTCFIEEPDDFAFLGLCLLVGSLIFNIKVFKLLKFALTPNWLLRFLLVFIVGPYFGVYIVIMGLISMINKKKIKSRIAELKANI